MDRDVSLSPSQLNTLARTVLEDTFPVVRVEGELSGVSRPASGHLYFALKDARAQVRCALFKPKSQWLRFQPRDGMQVLARGRLTLYEARGEYQLILDSLEEAGEGALHRAFEVLRTRLQAEGLFAPERKRALPRFVRRVGILTSPGGAAIHDVLSVLGRRFPLIDVELIPVPVQGPGAGAVIAETLTRAARSARHDVLLLTRGGGSLEDLWAFNEEVLARAVAASPVPVIAAVGHESDVCLAEFAADLRAATPSAAAELLSPRADELTRHLQALRQRVSTQQQYRLQQSAQRLDRLWLRLQARSPAARLQAMAIRQLALGRRLEGAWKATHALATQRAERAHRRFQIQHPTLRLSALATRLAAIRPQLQRLLVARMQQDTLRLRAAARGLHALSPLATLERGYAIVTDSQAHAVQSVAQVAVGDRLHLRLADGRIEASVDALHAIAAPELP